MICGAGSQERYTVFAAEAWVGASSLLFPKNFDFFLVEDRLCGEKEQVISME